MVNRPRRRALAVLGVVVLVALAGCSGIANDPAVCLSCEKGIEAAAGENADVSVSESELEISLREDGDARWTVRSNLTGEDASALRSSPDRAERLADDAVTDSVGEHPETPAIHGGNVSDVSATVEGRTLVITFAVSDVATESFGGVLLVDYFNTRGEPPGRYSLGADRVVLRGPPGTVATDYPPGAEPIDGGRAVAWSDSRAGVPGDAYVAFAPDRKPATRLAADVAVGLDAVRWLAPAVGNAAVLWALGLFAAAVGLSLVATGRTPTRLGDEDDAPFVERFRSDPPIESAAVVALAALLVVWAGVGRGGVVRDLVRVLSWPPIVPAALFLCLGAVAGRSGRKRRAVVAAITCVPFVIASPAVATTTAINRTGLVLVSSMGVTLLACGPLFYLGRRLRAGE